MKGYHGEAMAMNAATLVTGIVALVLLGACGDDESPSPQFPDVTIQQRDFYFEPMNLTSLEFLSIRSGDTAKELTLEIKNAGSVAHTFTITEPAIDEELQPGDVRLARMLMDRGRMNSSAAFIATEG